MSADATTQDELHSHLALALVPGLGPKLTAALLAHFGSASAALAATAPQLLRIPLIGDKLASQFVASFRTVDAKAELALLTKHGVTPLLSSDPRYPSRLLTITDAPSLMYVKGETAASDANSIGIVGSRACTPYGKRITERIAGDLARAGWTVISGLARGIDACAHRGALDAGGRTIAVLAGGLAKIYPPEHKDLSEQVAKQGYLITETPMTVAPQPGMFPARNRIISALSRAIVVVEANIKSGALITVTHAAEQGREVFVVPGPVDSEASAGCLELIRKGARLVRNADDILEDVRGIAPPDAVPVKKVATLFDVPKTPAVPVKPEGLDEVHQKVWDALTEPKHADELTRVAGVTASELSRVLMMLELKRIIKRLPGNVYDRR
ncbi:DNA-processing protein DprA [soil metagenome]